MKKFLIPILMALLALAVAQQETTVQDAKHNFVLRFREFSFKLLPGPVYRFKLRSPGGKVYVESKKQGIELFAPAIDVDAVSSRGKEADGIKTATATGGVRAIRTGSDGRSEITGKSASYTRLQAGAKLQVAGPVHLTNFAVAGQQTQDATGSSLVAMLSRTGEVDTATLNGPVKIKVRQAPQGGNKATDLNLTGDTMVLEQHGKPGKITLSGHVMLSGLVAGNQFEGHYTRVVLTLDQNGEVSSFEGVLR